MKHMLLLLLFFALPCSIYAHNGAVALAYPVEGITIDADFGDWPDGLPVYPIALTEDGSWPEGEGDVEATFRIGHNLQDDLLYLAIDVRDESIIDTSTTRAWDSEDAVEVFLSLAHDDQSSGVQYALRGRDSVGSEEDAGSVVRGRGWHGEGRHRYEWQLPIEGRTSSVLSFDISLIDRDADNTYTWLAWGGGVGKQRAHTRRGDVVLVGSSEVGSLSGRVVRSGTEHGLGRARVQLISTADSTRWVKLETGSDGSFTTWLPVGEYRLHGAAASAGSRDHLVEIGTEDPVEVVLSVAPAVGRVRVVGPGHVVDAGHGQRVGAWHSFGAEDGLLRGSIRSMAVDEAGYLWLGSSNGVSRFDGGQFVHFTAHDGFPESAINDLLSGQDGLWIAAADGLYLYDGTYCTRYGESDGLPADNVSCLAGDGGGVLWVGTDRGLSRVDGRYFTSFGADDGISTSTVSDLNLDDRGRLWLGTQTGLFRLEGGRIERVEYSGPRAFPQQALSTVVSEDTWPDIYNLLYMFRLGGFRHVGAVNPRLSAVNSAVFRTGDGQIWITTPAISTENLAAWQLLKVEGDKLRQMPAEGLPNESLYSMVADREGGLWFGSEGHIARFDPSMRFFGMADGLPSNNVTALLEDDRGKIWVGTHAGLGLFDGSRFKLIQLGSDPSTTHDVSDIAQHADGRIWVGTRSGLYAERQAAFVRVIGPGGAMVRALHVQEQGLWASTHDGVYVFAGDQTRRLGTADGLSNDLSDAITGDGQGRIWVGTNNGLDLFENGRFVDYERASGFVLPRGRQRAPIDALAYGSGALWVGTQRGLYRSDGGEIRHITALNGLANNWVYSLNGGRQDRMWIGTASGLSVTDGHLLQTQTLHDGLPASAVNEVLEDHLGRVWVATMDGLMRYQPNPSTPNVAVSDIITEGRQGPLDRIELTTSQDLLTFEVQGISLKTRPGGLRYRYRLAGHDDWRVTSSRQIEYADLPAGDFVFEVQAIDRDLGVTPEPAQVRVEVHHPYGLIVLWSALGLALGALVWMGGQVVRRNARLRRQEARFRGLLESAPDGMVVVDAAGEISLFNTQAEAMFGHRQAEVLGKEIEMLIPERFREKHPSQRGRFVADLQTRPMGADVELLALRRDGSEFPVEINLSPIDSEEGAFVVAAVRDITARREAEAELRKLSRAIEYSPASVVITDPHGTIEYVNPRFVEVTGYSAEEAIGQNPRMVSSGTQSPELYRQMWETIRSGREWRGEFCNRKKGGELYWEYASISPILDASGEATHYVAVKEDITERKRNEVELQEARAKAEDANRSKSAFLANMSHEIRTPMNGVVGMVDLLKRTELDTNQRNYLATVDSSADALLVLLNDILDLSKIEAGSMSLESIDFELREVTDGVMRLMGMRAHEKGLELACHVNADVPDGLRGDPTRLRQIIINLIGNAIKFTSEGEVVVDVQCREETEEEVDLRVAVRDTGIGIPEEKCALIFEAFSQADASTTRHFGGTGLGLNISQQLVELMGGRIWVESEEGVGSVFQFTARFGRSEVEAKSRSSMLKHLGELRVLGVDDNATNRMILEDMLGSWGISVIAVDSGQQALEVLRQTRESEEPFDLVLLDAMMPEMDGLELARQISQDPELADQPMMMLTSLDDPDYLKQVRAQGVRHILRKPITQSDLLDGIVTMLSSGQGTEPQQIEETATAAHAPLRVLLADDNETNQYVAISMLEEAGHQVVAVDNGREAFEKWEESSFDLILMDVQMPEMDGYEATSAIRQREAQGESR
ncbi:MAG: PAS domain S-box protein, partial [Gemmatimonadetes bacterium]|nr:PAS domain S-box protein [Gemmatimonadota bacterium]